MAKTDYDKEFMNFVDDQIEEGTLLKMEAIERKSTGLLSIDYMLGGGIPVGMSTMLVGKGGSGKTSLSQIIAAYRVSEGDNVLVVDLESKWDKSHFEKLVGAHNVWNGQKETIYKSKVALLQSLVAEVAAEIILKAARGNYYDMIIIDSVARIEPATVTESGAMDNQWAARAKFLSEFWAKVIPAINKNRIVLLCINQFRQKMDQYGQFVMVGGEATRHAQSNIVSMLSPKDVGGDKNIKEFRGKTVDRTVGVPEGIEFSVIARMSPYIIVNRNIELLTFGKKYGIFTNKDGDIIKGSAAWHYGGEKIAGSFEEAQTWINQQSKEQLETIRDLVMERIKDEFGT